MTSTVNGCGTALCGERPLNAEELVQWSEKLPYHPGLSAKDYRIATESIVFFLLPVFPLRTIVYYYTEKSLMKGKYVVVYAPAGEDGVYWEHVKKSSIFYILPALIILGIIWWIASPKQV